MMGRKYRTIISIACIILLMIHISCLDAGLDAGTDGAGTRVLIGFPTEQCLNASLGRHESTQQSIQDCIAFFTLTVTDGFPPIEVAFEAEQGGARVNVPIGNDRNFMVVGREENGDPCCNGGITSDVFPGSNTLEITCIPAPTPTPTPIPTPTPGPTPTPTPIPIPTPTPIPTPRPTPIPIPTPTPTPTPTPIPTPTPTGCTSDEDCPPGEICDFNELEIGICVPGCRSNENCPEGEFCNDGMCQPIPTPTPTPIPIEVCNDGIDNDGDGLIDCADPDCEGQEGPCSGVCEQPELTCDDDFDNDGDGLVDCADPDCEGEFGPNEQTCEQPEMTCDDGADNDGDGLVDCADSDCALDPNCIIG